MAVTVYETQETRGFSEASGKINASRKFVVWDDASAITEPASIRAQFGQWCTSFSCRTSWIRLIGSIMPHPAQPLLETGTMTVWSFL